MSSSMQTGSGANTSIAVRGLPGAICTVLATALLLTTATQLRLAAAPVGIGEVLLAAWIVWQLIVVSTTPPTLRGNDISVYLLLFWLTFFLVMLVALAISYQRGYWDENGAVHDSMALVFSAAFSVLLGTYLVDQRKIESLVRKLIWIGAIFMALLLMLAARRGTFLGIDPWYAAIRFTGWAKNPNQIGLLLVSFPFLALWLRQQPRTRGKKGIAVATFVLVVAGLLSQSDALYLGWACGGMIVIVFLWADMLARRGVSRRSAFLGTIGIPGLMLAAILWFAAIIYVEIKDTLIAMYELGGQGSVRLQIWSHGISAFLESPLFGHGPGAFAGVRDSFVGFEAHNTFIDIATKAGLIGLVLYLSILIVLHIQLLRTNQYYLLAALASVTVFSVFHYVLRQPVYWTVVVICLRMAWQTKPIGTAQFGETRRSPKIPAVLDSRPDVT